MSETTYDIGEMLDGLGMTTAAIRWKQILDDPELGNFSCCSSNSVRAKSSH